MLVHAVLAAEVCAYLLISALGLLRITRNDRASVKHDGLGLIGNTVNKLHEHNSTLVLCLCCFFASSISSSHHVCNFALM